MLKVSGHRTGGTITVTEDSLKDSQEMLQELSKRYGCYGIKTTTGFGVWIDQWIANGGDQNALEGLMMVVNKDTNHMTMWVIEEVCPA
jgi:hypothetical protein